MRCRTNIPAVLGVLLAIPTLVLGAPTETDISVEAGAESLAPLDAVPSVHAAGPADFFSAIADPAGIFQEASFNHSELIALALNAPVPAAWTPTPGASEAAAQGLRVSWHPQERVVRFLHPVSLEAVHSVAVEGPAPQHPLHEAMMQRYGPQIAAARAQEGSKELGTLLGKIYDDAQRVAASDEPPVSVPALDAGRPPRSGPRLYPVGGGYFLFMRHGSRADFEVDVLPALEKILQEMEGEGKSELVILHDAGYHPERMTVNTLSDNFQRYAEDYHISLSRDPIALFTQIFGDRNFGRLAYEGYRIADWQKSERARWGALKDGDASSFREDPGYLGALAEWVAEKNRAFIAQRSSRRVDVLRETYSPDNWYKSVASHILGAPRTMPEAIARRVPHRGLEWFMNEYARLTAFFLEKDREGIRVRNKKVRDTFDDLVKKKRRRARVVGVMGLAHIELASSKARMSLLEEEALPPTVEVLLRRYSSQERIPADPAFSFYLVYDDLVRAYIQKHPRMDSGRLDALTRRHFDRLTDFEKERLLAELVEKIRTLPPDAEEQPLLSWDLRDAPNPLQR